MRFTDIFIKRPVLAMSLSLLILVLGAYSLTQLQLRQYPEMQNTVITITTMYPGASSDLVQGFVTQPIQQAVASANGVEYIESQSQTGQSVITVNVRLNFDPNAALSEVLSKVQSVRYQLPKEVYDPAIVKSTGDQTSAMYLAFYSDKLSAEQISDYLNRAVRPKLSTVAGVADPKILGEQAFSMRIWLDPRRMAALSVTAEDVSNALLSNNVQASPGTIQGYFDIYKIDAKTDLNKAEDFAAIIVRAQQDAVVRLGDVAQVIMESKSRDVRVQISGQPAVFIGVDLTPDANPLTVVDDLRKILPEVESNLPSGLKMQIAYDSTVFIRASIDGVVETLWEAVIIVMVVVTLFLGSLRATVIPLVAIPLSLVGVAIVMSALGFSLNLLTLLAMVLAIGLVVDDAIVVVENVHRHIEEGRQPIEAALVGMREIAVPIITMTLTLAAVYTPIALVSGLTGALFREFALALAGSVIVSGIIALTLSPMMA
ncbi:MAG: efflux RND transporter permease subunit, partial [Halothiobacillaceae bacterium]|nr:efflux RND transporter permease subunit [Halothiobacillaceae bacterium]